MILITFRDMGYEQVYVKLAPSNFREELRATASAMLTKGKGLLACDDRPMSADLRITYLQMQFATPGLSQAFFGAIMHEETVEQEMRANLDAEKQKVPAMLKSLGIITGVNVDKGGVAMMGKKEAYTQELDGLGDRCKKLYELGCRFARWRCPLYIGAGMPSEHAIRMECYGIARYASICQENGLMPIVEPDVVMDDDHSIDERAIVTKTILTQTFAALDRHNVDVEGILIKSTSGARPSLMMARSATTYYEL